VDTERAIEEFSSLVLDLQENGNKAIERWGVYQPETASVEDTEGAEPASDGTGKKITESSMAEILAQLRIEDEKNSVVEN
jgi:hypothetical protein